MATLDHLFQDRFLARTKNKVSGQSWIDNVTVGVKMGWRAYLRYKRLSRLSDEALQKQGLKRHEIGRYAFFVEDR